MIVKFEGANKIDKLGILLEGVEYREDGDNNYTVHFKVTASCLTKEDVNVLLADRRQEKIK